METTQKNREKTPQRRPRQEAPEREPARRPVQQDVTPPPSAQQNNGAIRTAEEQRTTAAVAVKQRSDTATDRPRREASEKVPASRRQTAAKTAKPVKKKPVQKKQTTAPKKRPVPKADPDDISAKKRAYGNSKPKKTAASSVTSMIQSRIQKSEEKKKKNNRPKQPTPAVIYTQPQAFNRNRLFIQLVTVTAVVAALVLGLSVFFKVDQVLVSGAEVYSEYTIQEKSGIQIGDNLLTFSRPRAGALIKANLPYVDTVRFGIKLPGTVNIIIEEDDVVYAIKDQNEAWWLMNSDGRVVEQATGNKAANHTQVLGVTLESPIPDTTGVATEVVPTETIAGGELAPVTVTNAQRLRVALEILQALENNDIVGSAASVDVTRLEDIILWYGTRYQVNLGDNSRIDYKIACMNDVILQMSDYQSGILDISFTIWPNQVGYTPFS